MLFRLTSTAFAAVSLAVATPVLAQSRSTTMAVTATVLENCNIAATPMAFGTLGGVGGTDSDTTALVTLTCTPNADFEVAMDNGQNAQASQRRLRSVLGTEYLPYQIYRDAGRTQAWGSTSGLNTQPGTAPLGLATFTAYGRIPASATPVTAGVYTDTVTVTVNF
ncbi:MULTISPECIES: Csu type fimbrial protein [unclassified Sphingomonas]|uniref:Csu type fimbrial protein n=1 Tax=unclassified Sphingomonas TaxID=196159 RepID=UPI000B1658F0|nr:MULTISPECIES: spore coat U domain-containing protein [unclassified Sphingomonas]MCH4893079.1 fimbrial major subunit CsuA/B family protein [Sphingomonas sp. SFZ2018-12]